MDGRLLVVILGLVAYGNAALSNDDVEYLIGLRDLYLYLNLTVETAPPFAALAFNKAGTGSETRNDGVLEPCLPTFSSATFANSVNHFGAQDNSTGPFLTYSALLVKLGDIWMRNSMAGKTISQVHVYFSHLPGPATFSAVIQFAKNMPTTEFVIGYGRNAPKIRHQDITDDLVQTATKLAGDLENVKFGRICGEKAWVASRVPQEVLSEETTHACQIKFPELRQNLPCDVPEREY